MELAHAIMEGEDFYSLSSISWRPRKAAVIQSLSKGQKPETLMSESRREWMSELKQEDKFTLPLPFCSLQTLSGLDHAHLHW